jgi:uncharacterized protein YndB with AHSA1/START domain
MEEKMANESNLKFERVFTAPVQVVYRAFTNASALREWLCDGATTEAAPNGRMLMWWNDGYISAGRFKTLEPNQKIVFTWKGENEPAETTVAVTLAQEGEKTNLSLVHSGIGSGDKWAAAQHEFSRGWESALENLTSILEVGKDLRLYRRPMLGIFLSDFSPEIANNLGVPVKEGIRLGGTVEGMGARAAGLMEDDVLIRMNSTELKTYPNLTQALSEKHAGDVVVVDFYRGAEKKTTQMKLSGRPVPEIPANFSALADRLESMYAENDIKLVSALEGVSESEAAARPSPKEWSVKDVLAHLIQTERDNNIWIADLLGGHERFSDDWDGNLLPPLEAIVDVYPTTLDLLAELKRREAETVALLRRMPVEFLQRKGSFWRLATQLLEYSVHIQDHMGQIRNAITATRK